MKLTLKRLLSIVLAAAFLINAVPTQVFAAEQGEVYLPQGEIGKDILDYDVFYLATAAANVEENSRLVYLLKVGRGGPANSESAALVKIADMTAKYGEDYVVRVRGERTKVENPEGNFSLMELIEDSSFEQTPISDSDEFADMMENDPDAQTAYREGVETALEFLEDASGLSDKYDGENPYAEPVEEMYGSLDDETPAADAEVIESDEGGVHTIDADIEAVSAGDETAAWDEGAIPAIDGGEVITIGGAEDEYEDVDPVQAAANLFAGEEATAQRLTTEGDMFQDLQAIANVMTNVVVGASVELTFAPGESEKYLEIVPRDNRRGDGDRMFYIILGAPSGATTNSAASTCAVTIIDDEDQEPAMVSFSDAVYYADSESVTVTVERSGAMNTVVSATVKTTGEGSAQAGRDYSEVDAELVFPFGVNHLTLDIPVRTEYLTGEGDFGLALEPIAGCEVGEIASANVFIDGTYTDKAGLYAAEDARLMSASVGKRPLMAASSTPVDENNLSTYRTLNAINIRNPLTTGTSGSGYKGINAYNGSGFWQTKWKGGDGGTVRVAYELTDNYWQSYFLAGAEVDWWRSYGCGSDKAATMKVSLAGKRPGLTEAGTHDYIYQESLGYRYGFYAYNEWYPYNSKRDFGRETRYIYPTNYATSPNESNSRYCYLFGPMWAADHPQAIDFLNLGVDDDCSQLWLWGIKPILRPFQVNIKAADPLIYLKADGTRSEVTNATTTNATIVEAGSKAVLFQNDSFTVSTNAGPDVSQYGYLSAVRLMNGANENKALYTLAANGDPSNTSIKYTLNTDNMQKLISSICPDYKHGFTQNWYNLLRENPYAKENRSNVDGYPTYVLFNVKPEFSYINSSVTLRNPYDFPVTMTISGSDYTLAARETRKIKAPDGQEFHLGDTLAVTNISLHATDGVIYTPVGVKYWAINPQTNEQANGAMNFADGKPVNFAGFDGDGRLRTKEIIVEPNLQVSENRIQVRVKTSELSKFHTAIERDRNGNIVKHAGVLAQEGTLVGEYTYFTFADEANTVNGKLYAITATPREDYYVAEWYDSTTMRTYVGNTLYFTATDTPERNVITLSVAPVSGSVTLEGTLYYKNYNLRTGYSGNASNVPTVGAALSAGSAGGIANRNGYVTAGPVPVSGREDRYLRYMVSLNGTDLVKELQLPVVEGTDTAVLPNMLWDFNSDNAMHSRIVNSGGYYGEKDQDGNDYYTFSGSANISNTSRVSNDEIQWIKLRAKVVSGTGKIGFNGANDDWNAVQTVLGGMFSLAPYDLTADGQWHDYVFNIPQANLANLQSGGGRYTESVWKETFDSITFNPSLYSGNGVVQVDYMAFFSDKETADAYTPNGRYTKSIINISSNFPSGVSPVNSAIFGDIQITGKMSDSAYQVQDNTYIPVVPGKSADMTIRIKPAEYSYTMTGEKGAVIQGSKTEYPVSVQLVVYDSNDVFKDVYDAVDSFRLRSGYMTATSHVDFVEPSEGVMKTDENGKPVFDENGEPVWVEEPVTGILPEPGDKLYLRLVTDRLLQAEELADGGEISGEYRYSDIFTGMYFYQPTAYERPPEMGIRTPIEIEYGNLPLIGSTGMDLAFPFVSVGIMKIQHGYRIYIGVSPVQIMDTVKGTHVSAFSGAGGEYWKSLFSIKSPFQSFSEGLSQASETIGMVRDAAKETAASNKANGTNESVGDAGLGSHSWRFDISVGMYFDFINLTVNQSGTSNTSYVFNGMGGYVSVTLGFTTAWYIVLPVVFLPAYLGIEIQGTVMGYLGATFNKDVEITYADALNGSANINDGISELTGGIRGYGYVQISLGVGLCGTLGVRASGKVNLIASWEPDDPNGSWGAYIGLQAGLIIDLFLFSIPLMYSFAGWPFGSFEYYSNPEKWTSTPNSLQTASTFSLRKGSGKDSMWLGDQMMVQGAFRPNKLKEKILVADAYERPDAQLITLSDGESLALAFIDSDNAKGAAQRTTLKMATYAGGQWSELVTVSGDNTADFQPSIAETKDGKLLVAWVSPTKTDADLSNDDGVMAYLNSMEVYAAFIELDGNKQIVTKNVGGVTAADTEVIRITNDHYTRANGTVASYYDSNPTVVCDMESGDAMIYYIKSGRSSLGDGQITDYINPYTNDCVVCYMPFNAEADTDTDGRTVPSGWLFNNFYYSELGGNTVSEQTLIDRFEGQRFLAGASYTKPDGTTERYTIPDFTAIGYNGLAVYAYTVDTDGKNDTDADKELYLQVYDFRTHETKFRIALTDDDVSDAMPQFFRSRVNSEDGYSTGEANTHTKLFWYRDGRQVVYIDVTALLRDGINANGTLKTEGETECSYTDPIPVYFYADDSHASLQSADFKAVEDDRGNLYILWTDSVTDENGNAAQEIFGTGLVEYAITDEEGNPSVATSGWSKPYQLTGEGYNNDELAVAMSGENLIVVHNRFRQTLVIPEDGKEYKTDAVADYVPIQMSEMALVADTMEPCGSVKAEHIGLYYVENVVYTDEEGNESEAEILTPVTLPIGGRRVRVEVYVENNGMNVAEGYKLSLCAVDKSGNETQVGSEEVTASLAPNMGMTYSFDYTLPADVDGLTFKAVAQEMRDAETKTYYRDTDTYISAPLETKASYEISAVETYQAEDGFRAKFTVSNNGNAASGADDTLNIQLWGPANLANAYPDEQGSLYSKAMSLGIGETEAFDIPVNITPEMMSEYGFVTARAAVQKEVVSQTVGSEQFMSTRFLSNLVYADFDLVIPMNMVLQDVTVGVDDSADITFAMNLGDKLRGGAEVSYAVDDLTIAKVVNGKVVGVNGGETTLHATHTGTGATVSSTVTVTGERETPDIEIAPTAMSLNKGDTAKISYRASHEGTVIFTSSNTGVVTVDESGNVKAVGAGTATITVTLTDAAGNTYTATCAVSVTGSSTPVYSDPEPAPDPNPSPKPIAAPGYRDCDRSDTCPMSRFNDLDKTSWYHDGVHWALENGIMNGYGDGKFAPSDTTSRAMIVTMLHRIEGEPTADYDMGFTDVESGNWYTEAIRWAAANGIVTGYGNGKFGPNDVLTREQLAAILYRYAKIKGQGFTGMWAFPLNFDDAADVSDWAYEPMCWMTMQGVIQGTGSSKLSPKGSATRAQVATMLMRYKAIEQ